MQRILRLKNLSPAQPPPHRPTFTASVNAQSFSVPNERDGAGVETCNLKGETRRRVSGMGVALGPPASSVN